MEQYTDDERVEDLKKWWRDNGASIIIGIALGVAAIFGWRAWVSYRDTQAEQASLAYDAFIEAVEKPDAAQARQRGDGLLADFPKSSYTVLASLRLASVAMDNGDSAEATRRLQWVIDQARLAELQDIARLRLARVQLAAGQQAEAEKLLERVSTPRLRGERQELYGDLALAARSPDKARTAYTEALAASPNNAVLRLKLENLAIPAASSVIATPAAPPVEAPAPAAEPAATSTPPAPEVPVADPAPAAAPEVPTTGQPVTETPPVPAADPVPATAAPAPVTDTPSAPTAPATPAAAPQSAPAQSVAPASGPSS